MNRQQFETLHASEWGRFEAAVARFEKGEAADSDLARDFPTAYRRICHHLALARQRCLGADIEEYLDGLVVRGHRQLYGVRPPEPSSWRERAAAFPRQVRREARLMAVATLLLAVPFALMNLAVRQRPELAYTIVPEAQVERIGEQYAPDSSLESGRPFAQDVAMFGYYIYNNIGIAFRAFASGALFGVGALFVLVVNGALAGAIVGYIGEVGYGESFYSFVIGHAAFELTAIVLAAAAGLRIGLALLSPGQRSRRRALGESARESVVILYGAAAMLLIAAFLEAFWSSSALVPATVKLAVGGLFWASVFSYLLLAGRGHGR